MKKDRKQTHDAERRKFLRGSAVAGLGVAAAASMPGAMASESVEHEQTNGKGYQLSQHVLDYYKTLTS